jgi:molybdenum cofactor cytidylyltransferase
VIVGLLLAAGGARRFGSQKLVAMLDGAPLVARAARALAAMTDSLVIVIGHDAVKVRAALRGVDAVIVDNIDWTAGLASSIRCGMAAVPAGADAVVVALGDQPGIDALVVGRLIERWHASRRPIVATRYRGQRGHPVLFARALFPEVIALSGDVGAKGLIDSSADRVEYVDVDTAPPPDVDTPGDLDALRSR